MTHITKELCSGCGRWHDETARPVIGMHDWDGRYYAVHPGTRPTSSIPRSWRVYGSCVMGAPENVAFEKSQTPQEGENGR